ncbi:MAG: zinc ABC transporter substrate-binding protein [Solobacterium sp.]|nr:zinc ABC transporter substrate-binding protein [Solobacterium sp.]
MKRLLTGLLSLVLLGQLTACGSSAEKTEDSGKLQIVATVFPAYDWACETVKNTDSAEVTLLTDKGVDLHSYQPSVQDIQKIASCDLLIYIGGPSDEWVDDVLAQATNPDMETICLLDVLGERVKEEETVEGMQEEEEEEEEGEADEHVWLSLRNAKILAGEITEALVRLDGSHSREYEANAAEYTAKLEELDKAYEQAVNSSERNTLLFADRFPFRYMTDDYGLQYYAAFPGCSAETGASFETVTFLADKTDELSLKVILTIEGSAAKIAETIRDTTKTKDQMILTMDSMQSVTAKDIAGGKSYLSVMEENLEVLKEALQ